jgi:uncharacterized membrane protein YkvA (DUF1232 family)
MMAPKELTNEEVEGLVASAVPDGESPELGETKIRNEFAAKYGKVGKALLASRWKVVRDLGINVMCLWEMLVDPDYPIAWKTKSSIIGALGYFISPLDAIPDFTVGIGYVDDALVVAYVVHRLATEIADYRKFRREKGRPLPDA